MTLGAHVRAAPERFRTRIQVEPWMVGGGWGVW